MDKLILKLENCYGIRSLSHEFNFTKKPAAIVYAPNGVMKSSFARTFSDLSQNEPSADRIFTNRQTVRKIDDENGDQVISENVFVVEPYSRTYESQRVSTLLANKALKIGYDEIIEDIDSKSENLLKAIAKDSGVRKSLDELYSATFTREKGNFLRALERVKSEVLNDPEDLELKGVKYNDLFGDKIAAFLSDDEIRNALEDYTANYDNLLSKSRFFRRGVFNHFQAGQIAKQLKQHGFFKADHKVSLNSGENETRVETEQELESIIADELQAILTDENLKTSFDKIDKKLSNTELRAFRDFILERRTMIPRLRNLDALREELLKTYLRSNVELFEELMEAFETGRKRLDEITQKASEEATQWQEVINIFNRRFSVPFEVSIDNKQDVILKRVTPNIAFTFFDDSGERVEVDRDKLLNVLSTGELRALYILNIIFEVQARIEEGIPTLFVIDDVADSFDYKNKYAIVEYLADMLQQPNFRLIILTHNYDFYRTVWRRLDLGGANYLVTKSPVGVELVDETMYRDPFQRLRSRAQNNSGREHLGNLVAMIPFVRNLAEYCGQDTVFNSLTSALHIKPTSPDLKIGELLEHYRSVLSGHEFSFEGDNNQLVTDLIVETANSIADNQDQGLSLEDKIILSMAIRLTAEKYLIAKIQDLDWVKTITKNQTAKLVGRFKNDHQNSNEKAEAISVMDRVNLMTPENIHLNSFMYEPILDMSALHLQRLYKDVLALGSS